MGTKIAGALVVAFFALAAWLPGPQSGNAPERPGAAVEMTGGATHVVEPAGGGQGPRRPDGPPRSSSIASIRVMAARVTTFTTRIARRARMSASDRREPADR